MNNPFPDNGLAVVTELSALTGAIGDPSARETTYTCPFDFSGEAEVCVTTTYEDGVQPGLSSDVASAEPKLGGPNVFLQNPLECSTTECTVVVCPEEKRRWRRRSEGLVSLLFGFRRYRDGPPTVPRLLTEFVPSMKLTPAETTGTCTELGIASTRR